MPIFAQGEPKNKLTLLFYLRCSRMELTREQLYRAVVENDCMTYIDFETSLHELEEDGLLLAVPRAFGQGYRLSAKGLDTLDAFVESLPVSLRTKLEQYASAHRETFLRETQLVSDMTELPGGGYAVTLRALERDAAVMELKLRVASRDMAIRMRKSWDACAEEAYAWLMKRLLETEK